MSETQTPQFSYKQAWALSKLDPTNAVKFLFYGGAAGGGKTILGCFWLMLMCATFPGTRWFIGRDSLKDTRESVLVSFRKVAKMFGYYDWKYVDNAITFLNGSEILFLDLSYYPQKDPMFERFGSKEYTGGWIEEAGETKFEAFDTLKTRVGRHMNEEYGIQPKILITANPKKNWIYDVFYKPWKRDALPDDYFFIKALYYDNPFLPKSYVEMLLSLTDKVKIERLKNGNFDYDDSPNALCSHDDILSMFGGNIVKRTGKFYLTADVARFGSDEAIIVVWDDWMVVDFLIFDVSKTTVIQDAINQLRRKYKIPKNRCIADDDGVGGGVVDNCDILGFVNNSKPFAQKQENVFDHETGKFKEHRHKEEYYNLQSQCGYKLAEKINSNAIGFAPELQISVDLKDRIVVDLEQLQTWESDKELRGLRIKPKDEIKINIRRSPDWRDVLLERAYFEYVGDVMKDLTGLF